MKLKCKKLLSIWLSVMILFSSFALCAGAKKTPDGLPTVYVGGVRSTIYSDDTDIESDLLNTLTISDEKADEIIEEASQYLPKNVISGNWDTFCDAVVAGINSELSLIKCDHDGDKQGTVGYDCLKTVPVPIDDDEYGLYDYEFVYDWRLSPLVNAIELNQYIKSVKEVTGADKVNLLSSGVGSSTVLAYFLKYGGGDVFNCLFINTTLDGIDALGALFTGEMEMNTENVHLYYRETLSATEIPATFIREILNLLNTFDLMEPFVNVVARVYELVYSDILPRVLRESYATMPGVWSLIGERYFEDAVESLLENPDDTTDYRWLAQRVRNYQNTVGTNKQQILDYVKKQGVNISFVVKYGRQMVPITDTADLQSDSLIAVTQTSLGAVCAQRGEKFSDEYIADANQNGSIAFISPDYEIDASAAKFGLHTWFIKNLDHSVNPRCVEELYEAILNEDGYMSVLSYSSYPQYLVVNDNATRMAALTASGEIDTLLDEQVEEFFTFNGIFDTLRKAFSATGYIASMLRKFISMMKSAIHDKQFPGLPVVS